MPVDPERHARLLAAKLRALIADHDPPGEPADVASFAGGAAAVLADGRAWALVEDGSAGLGAALAWASQRDARLSDLVVDGERAAQAGTIARRARALADPPRVWRVDGRALVAVPPEPAGPALEAHPAAERLVPDLEAAGLEVVTEGGVVRGEIRGLEVAVVTVDDDGQARVEVGVGRHDREAFAMLHGDLPALDAIRSVIDTVSAQRRPGASPHPLNRLAPERWLRWHLIDDPCRLEGWSLTAVDDVIDRPSLKDRAPAFASGTNDQGRDVIVACSVGVDLELVPVAADVRDRIAPEAHLVLAVPARDVLPVTQRAAAALARPAEIIAIEGDWRR